jgi:hypothetical protein
MRAWLGLVLLSSTLTVLVVVPSLITPFFSELLLGVDPAHAQESDTPQPLAVGGAET